MTCKESIKWLESLKKELGQSQYQGLWHYEQALAETIELLQSDRLVELPCKVGNLVFEPYRDFINVYEITTIRLSKYGLFFNWRLYNSGVYSNVNGFSEREINKTIFLTKEEAEAKLKELNNER